MSDEIFQAKYEDLGQIEYQKAWNYQIKLFNTILEAKEKGESTESRLLLCEHNHVFTLGKSGERKNLLISDSVMKEKGISFFQIDRGGDITYHGPGQLTVYPIFDLEKIPVSPKDLVFGIESAIIRTIRHYGLSGSRIENAAGVWLDSQKPGKARKIAAVGLRIHKKISMHGLALNVNTDLDYFQMIIPCGISNKGVTSIQKELGREVDINEVKQFLIKEFETVFSMKFEENQAI
ncbi:MAG: lipoyl(octanoyl) transferase LipB [Bacteroidales bacterium]|nr:lipoyl(octanoyl) transferase LipB [Bacteroidales bacterium]